MPGAGEKSVLMTPDPYHTPGSGKIMHTAGYGGFCPQIKYQIGETFGRTTSRLLRDDKVASSGRLVLADTRPATTSDHDKALAQKVALIQTRTQSWGDQKLGERMVPGYTGFIPKSQHYFGKRYAANCVNAISDFEGNQRGHIQKMHDLRTTECNKSAPEGLPAISKEPKPFISKGTPQTTLSPYYMNNDNMDKRYMSEKVAGPVVKRMPCISSHVGGYTGFVPRARNLLGMGYPLITHIALNDFTDDAKQLKNINNKPIQVHRPKQVKTGTMKIYPIESGLVPHYTGHIPGEKFRYGQTFGHSTQNAHATKQTAISACV